MLRNMAKGSDFLSIGFFAVGGRTEGLFASLRECRLFVHNRFGAVALLLRPGISISMG